MDWSELLNTAALQIKRQQSENETRMHETVASMQIDMDRMQKEHESTLQNAVERAQSDAAAEIGRAKREMEQHIQAFEEDAIRSADKEIQDQCAARYETLEAQFNAQREQLARECELILQEKDDEIQKQVKAMEQQHQLNLQLQFERLEETHRIEMEAMKNEIWSSANHHFGAETELMVAKVVAEAKERTEALQENIVHLRSQLESKDIELLNSADNMHDLDCCFTDVAREIDARHHSEMVRILDEKLVLKHENERLQKALHDVEVVNASLKEEVLQLQSKYRSIELKTAEQDSRIRDLDSRKSKAMHQTAEFQANKKLLEQQISEQKSQISSLTKALDHSQDLAAKATSLTERVSVLSERNEDLERECGALKRKCLEANDHVEALHRESHIYAQEAKYNLDQKESQIRHLTDAINEMTKKTNEKTEPVVVHLHGNQYGNKCSADTSRECYHLRTRLLELQRLNCRLENDLMDAKRESQLRARQVVDKENDTADVRQLQQENHSLRQIITMMRKEMEQTVAPSFNDDSAVEQMPLSYIHALEQQLLQCKSYLDILLKSRDVRGNSYDDEIIFLRLKYRELHGVLDQVREENLRLHGASDSHVIANDHVTSREQELIQKLEEATSEIEILVEERNELLVLSGLNNDIIIAGRDHHVTSSIPQQRQYATTNSGNNDRNLMSAILNDLSRDGDSETTHSVNNVVACFGNRPPRANASELKPSKNVCGGGLKLKTVKASARTTTGQRQSLERMGCKTNRQKKVSPSVQHEQQRIRNWNQTHDWNSIT